MPVFIARIEIYNGTKNDYKILNTLMVNNGFLNTIAGKTNKKYFLPNGEYRIETELSTLQVLQNAKTISSITITKPTGKICGVFVSKVLDSEWSGLLTPAN